MTLFNPLSETLFEFLNRVWSEIQPLDREGVFRKSSFEFLKRLVSTLNANESQSRKESVQKIARQEIEGFSQLLKTYISSVKDADLDDEQSFDSRTLLSWFIHRFWKSMVRHIFPATRLIAETFPQILPKLPETLHYIYDPHWFPQNFRNVPEIPSKIIQKLTINHHNIEIKNYIIILKIIIQSQPVTRLIETTDTDFNSTLLDDGTLFSSHTVNTLIHLKVMSKNNNQKNKNNNVFNNTTDNTHIYHNHQHRQLVNSTDLTQNSYLLNTTLPTLPNVNLPLQRLHRQNSVHYNSEPIILINSTQPTPATNQNFQTTPQQLVNIDRQINSQSTQQIKNAPTD